MQKFSYKRNLVQKILERISESRQFIQVVIGPRQVGKTTAVQQVLEDWKGEYLYSSADLPAPPQSEWIDHQWDIARLKAREGKPVILILDEIQKVSRWSETVKQNWEEDTRTGTDIRLVILGSSSLLLQAGLTESLAGRFELLHATHWSYTECRECFNWDIDKYIYFGGYPGAAPLIRDENRWAQYIRDSLIETAISKDILLLNRVEKPALLRQLFITAAENSGQIISYQKLLGQLHDAGNTTTLAHYKNLLDGAGLLCGLEKWSGQVIRQRASSPKWLVLNTGLLTALKDIGFPEWRGNPEQWGRLSESAVGAHLVNSTKASAIKVYYWRDRNKEVDFILNKADRLLAIEVKSGAFKGSHTGLKLFSEKYRNVKTLLVGKNGISIEEFLSVDADYWFTL